MVIFVKVIKVNPQGSCNGVKHSLKICLEALKSSPKPIYLLGPIIHNDHVNNALKRKGIKILEGVDQEKMIDTITNGTVIIPAFGIDSNSLQKAKNKGLNVVDASCPIVSRIHQRIIEEMKSKKIIYIGNKNHQEAYAISKENSEIIFLKYKNDIDNLDKKESYYLSNQTTLSLYDVNDIIEYAKNNLNDVEVSNEICNATTLRQEAINNIKGELIVIVGDSNSSNTNRLKEIASNNNPNSKIIMASILDDLKDIDFSYYKEAYITSGASTPTKITLEIIDYLENYQNKKAISTLNDDDFLNL